MNIDEYISSGKLEAYALGEVSEAERFEIEKNLSHYPKLRMELLKIETAQQNFLRDNGIPSSSEDKTRLITRGNSMPGTKIISLNPEHSVLFWRIATAAAVTLALITSYFVVTYRTDLEDLRIALTEQAERNHELASEYSILNNRLERASSSLNIAENPIYTRIILQNPEGTTDLLVTVFWNQRSEELFLSIKNLPAVLADQQFQLWAITDGKPVDVGVFDPSEEVLKMKPVHHASAFVITVEPRGGSVNPTDSRMLAIGKTGV